jgi:HSP20 family protein
MELMRWNPRRSLTDLHREIDRFFEDWPWPLSRREHEPASERHWAPTVDIVEKDDAFLVTAELPGMKMEDIDIELSNDALTIKGQRKFEHEEKKDNCVRIERQYGSFQRTFTVGVPIQGDKVEATYKDGLLTVTLPKAEEIKPKKVQVKTQ